MGRKVGIELNIDVTKIDKAFIYEGKKGKYLKLTSFIDLDEKDQYDNNGMVTQKVSKEAQDAGQKGAILGNSRIFWQDQGQAPVQQSPQQAFPNAGGAVQEDCPFSPLVDIRY